MPLYRKVGKRLLDTLGALVLLIVLAPFLCIVAAMIWLRLGGPVLFRQQRVGRDGVPFVIFKFRTMTDERDEAGQIKPDGSRLTRLGRILRGTSLDELPELLNVLRGEMSLVGPRPLLLKYLPLYSPRQARRHEVRPGITGWAQVNGRNALSWEEKFECDVWYADHLSLWLDLRILAMTLMAILRPAGINAEGHATMPEFEGERR